MKTKFKVNDIVKLKGKSTFGRNCILNYGTHWFVKTVEKDKILVFNLRYDTAVPVHWIDLDNDPNFSMELV